MAETFNKGAFYNYLFNTELYRASSRNEETALDSTRTGSEQIYGLFNASGSPKRVFGKYVKKVLVLCRSLGDDGLSKSESDLLYKILSSISLSQDDCLIALFDEESDCIFDAQTEKEIQGILCFGEFNLGQNISSSKTWEIHTSSLRELEHDLDSKRSLWAKLKTLSEKDQD